MTPGAILAALKGFFLVIGEILGIVRQRQRDVERSEHEAGGAAKAAAAAAAEAERLRKEDELRRREVAARSDGQLDADIDRWVRK